ncbi:serine hydrolase domain-containing protein [Pseudoxanthobacter sp. M-2]|uniref:serine hydrolase domain-containing protein n=1 Tax=Pseudoxanthobacter sp. M-2 TaxID=3078754 RepID=UPI0038FC5BFE
MPASPLPTAAPAAVGFRPDLVERFDAGVRSGLLRDLHAVVIARHGRIVLERFFEGTDEAWGRPLGTVAHGPETLHDLRSVTKSIVSGLLYGIALARGLVPPPETPLAAVFPEVAALAEPDRAGLKIVHALTMTLGLAWDESLPYTDPRNSEIAMEAAADRLAFVLSQPVVHPPGTQWTYGGGATALIGAIIARGTGRSLQDFAREALFQPLGIDRFEWHAGHDGVVSAASGLRLTARGLLRLGELLLARGRASDGTEIVPEDLLQAAIAPAATVEPGFDYGRGWFLAASPVPALGGGDRRWVGGFGNGGQRLFVMPETGISCAIFSGAYNAPDDWVTPTRVWREIVLSNLVAA